MHGGSVSILGELYRSPYPWQATEKCLPFRKDGVGHIKTALRCPGISQCFAERLRLRVVQECLKRIGYIIGIIGILSLIHISEPTRPY